MMINIRPNITKDKNFGISKNDFTEMVDQMRLGENLLFEQIFLVHCPECIKYLMSQLNISYQKSYDITMDTLIIFREKLIDEKFQYGNLRYLFTRMARFKALKEINGTKEMSIDEIEFFDTPEENNSEHKNEIIEEIMNSLDSLSSDKRKFLDLHYFNNLKLTEIATMLGENESTVRKRKQRILSFLKDKLKLDLY